MVNEQINRARDAFQSANVIQQLQIEALRCELRLRGLFSVQPRPTSLAYESTLAVLLKQMSDESSYNHIDQDYDVQSPQIRSAFHVATGLGSVCSGGFASCFKRHLHSNG